MRLQRVGHDWVTEQQQSHFLKISLPFFFLPATILDNAMTLRIKIERTWVYISSLELPKQNTTEKTEINFLTVLESRSPRSVGQQIWFLLRPVFFAGRWQSSPRDSQCCPSIGMLSPASSPLLTRALVILN